MSVRKMLEVLIILMGIIGGIVGGIEYVDAQIYKHVSEGKHDEAASVRAVNTNCRNLQILARWLAVHYGDQAPELRCGVD